MVQNCVFAQRSEFLFGVRSKTKLTLVQRIHISEKGLGITLVWQVWSSEKGPFLSPNSDRFGVRRKDQAKTWFGRFGERPVPFSELTILAGLEFRGRTGSNLSSAGSEFGERTGSNPGLVGLEFGERPDPFSELQRKKNRKIKKKKKKMKKKVKKIEKRRKKGRKERRRKKEKKAKKKIEKKE